MPIQTTPLDVVVSGHGSVDLNDNGTTKTPVGVEFILLAPPGAVITDHLGGKLEKGEYIDQLYLNNSSGHILPHEPARYTQRQVIPNLVLHPPRDLQLGSGVPHMIGVEVETPIRDIFPRLEPFRSESLKHGQVLKVYFAACSALTRDDPNTVFCY
ncbi:MAG: hypothetical protein J4F41_04515 [Alphaproteobacteria bacterium]|nr:hypothetical protein [Alphaproteobacteria bacterium]